MKELGGWQRGTHEVLDTGQLLSVVRACTHAVTQKEARAGGNPPSGLMCLILESRSAS